MSATLVSNNYGKSRVRVVKVSRNGERHDIKEISVDIQLKGKFDRVHTDTVYVMAKKHEFQSIEEFGMILADHFLATNPDVAETRISLFETTWKRISINNDGKSEPHPFSFVHGGNERQVSKVISTRTGHSIESGVNDLTILKTTDSGFENYIHDQYTTLKETHDRIFATSMNVRWKFNSSKHDFNAARKTIRQTLLEKFAQHYSYSVQQSLYLMGEAALEQCKDIEEISISMPNKHCLLFNLEQFGMENKNEIFVPTDEPHGLIEGTLRRK
ncbi:MAG: urate oxidase [Ignavibacteriales bacterium]|nr:urate oxidase [Ignavibacteriales bacterium]